MHLVTDAEYVAEYKLKITFDDDSVKLVDLEPVLWGTVFEPLRDPDYFKTVRVDPKAGTVVWDNGADVAPEYLYDKGVDISDVA